MLYHHTSSHVSYMAPTEPIYLGYLSAKTEIIACATPTLLAGMVVPTLIGGRGFAYGQLRHARGYYYDDLRSVTTRQRSVMMMTYGLLRHARGR